MNQMSTNNFDTKKKKKRSSHRGSAETNLSSIHEDTGLIPGLSRLRIQRCCELWCKVTDAAQI